MKLQIVSDLHLEFNDVTINNAGADILCLAGDVCLAKDLHKNNEKGEKFPQCGNECDKGSCRNKTDSCDLKCCACLECEWSECRPAQAIRKEKT